MHPVISLNRTMVEATKARVAAVSSSTLYGRGVFTTIGVYDSAPFLWSKHWQRLAAHAAKLDIDHTGCTEKSVGESLRKLIAVNQVKNGRARVTMLARTNNGSWKAKLPSSRKTDLLIMTHDAERVRVDERVQSISIVKSDFPADSRHAERIAVVRDAGHNTCEQRSIASSILLVVQ